MRDATKMFIGPWKLKDKDPSNKFTQDIMMTALVPGTYIMKYFSFQPINGPKSTAHKYFANENEFLIVEDKITYIGSYYLDALHLKPWERKIQTKNLSEKYLSKYKEETYIIDITPISDIK